MAARRRLYKAGFVWTVSCVSSWWCSMRFTHDRCLVLSFLLLLFSYGAAGNASCAPHDQNAALYLRFDAVF
jgi:hypothetical protein